MKQARTWIVGLAAAAAFFTGTAQATPVVWTLTDVSFSDGTAATGSFTYDADTNAYSNWAFQVADGAMSAFSYTAASAHQPFGSATNVMVQSSNPSRYLTLTFLSALTNAGGASQLLVRPEFGLSFFQSSYECSNCGTVRFITGGSVVSAANDVPEPATLLLAGGALAGLALARRRRQA